MRLGKLEITLDLIAACAHPASATGRFGLQSRLLPVHPHHVGGAHDGAAIDVDSGAFVDVVADAHVGAADDALAAAGLVAAHVVHIAFVVQVGRLATEKDVGRDLLALVHLVGDDVGHGVAAFGGRQAHIGQQVDQDKLRVFGGGGFVGHGVYYKFQFDKISSQLRAQASALRSPARIEEKIAVFCCEFNLSNSFSIVSA